jgi:RNase P/RNase MRP subunit p30
MAKRKSKSKPCINNVNKPSSCYDLNVPVLSSTGSTSTSSTTTSNSTTNRKASPTTWRGSKAEQRAIVQRLNETGYSTIALSHQIHGRVKPNQDESHLTIPLDDLLDFNLGLSSHNSIKNNTSSATEASSSFSNKKKRRDPNGNTIVNNNNNNTNNTNNNTKMKILKRLNVIIEQESDLASYSTKANQETQTILSSYDIIALSPRNETTFTAICNSPLLKYCDIILLDYTAGRGNVQLPFKIKSSHIAQATRNGLAMELNYAPAILDPAKRKAFILASRQLMTAAAAVGIIQPKNLKLRLKPRIIISSGNRFVDGDGGRDHGSMALRSSGDIAHFSRVVLGFTDSLVLGLGVGDVHVHTSSNIMQAVVDRGQNRKLKRVVGKEKGVVYQVTIGNHGTMDQDEGDGDGDGDGDEKVQEEAHVHAVHEEKMDTMNGTDRFDKADNFEEEEDSDDGDGFLRLG